MYPVLEKVTFKSNALQYLLLPKKATICITVTIIFVLSAPVLVSPNQFTFPPCVFILPFLFYPLSVIVQCHACQTPVNSFLTIFSIPHLVAICDSYFL